VLIYKLAGEPGFKQFQASLLAIYRRKEVPMKRCGILLLRFAAICGLLAAGAAAQTQATYFTFRFDSLKQQLNLASDQEKQVKHVIEQETGELMQVVCNPATSRKRQLAMFNDILKESEASMQTILTKEQYRRLPQLREKMTRELKTRKAAQGCTMDYWATH
jgi:hypothetical protein